MHCIALAFANTAVNSHRNASLRKWLVEEHMLGDMGMGHPAVDGIYPTIVNMHACIEPGLSLFGRRV